MRTTVVLALLAMAGCAIQPTEPRVERVEVKVPVRVSCLPADMPAAPSVKASAQLQALDDFDLVLELAAERDDLISYVEELDAVLVGCR
ncbi:MAG TPA: hypothetical protein VMU55_02455 [Solirubrobacteraceae bacterium]|nr:hypothetical protein [Solirubrobacteraceae bacterium]